MIRFQTSIDGETTETVATNIRVTQIDKFGREVTRGIVRGKVEVTDESCGRGLAIIIEEQ